MTTMINFHCLKEKINVNDKSVAIERTRKVTNGGRGGKVKRRGAKKGKKRER